jgi:two-component system cell cycle response regulator
MLEGNARLDIAEDAQHGVFQAAEGAYDCIIVSVGLSEQDPLRLCSQLRSIDRTRFVPILLLADQGDDARITRAMELGVNDYIYRPVDRQELLARLRTQVKRKTYNDHLRLSVTRTIEMAVTDGLTGLHNRRYLDSHLDTLFERAIGRHRSLSILIADIDHFKHVNDTYGHDAGDAVLKEFARRLRQSVRGIDLACRYGGEEFVLAMPDTDGETALVVAERLRAQIAGREFSLPDAQLSLTASIGVTSLRHVGDSVEGLMKRADVALYDAKRRGRNRVVSDLDHLHSAAPSKVTGLG